MESQIRSVTEIRGGQRMMMPTYLDEMVNRKHSTVAILYKNVDVEALNELRNFIGCNRASSLPYSRRVFSSYTDNNLCVLR